MPRYVWLILALVFAGLAAAWVAPNVVGSASVGVWPLGQPASASGPAEGFGTVRVERRELEVIHTEEGALKPVRVTTVGFSRWGQLEWMVDEGSRVKKGDPVARLESESLADEISALQDEVTVAQQALLQEQENRALEKRQQDSELNAEKDRVELARLQLSELRAKPTDLEKQDAQNVLDGAQARLKAKQADLEALLPLAEQGYVQQVEREEQELAVHLAEAELAKAKIKAERILRGAREDELKKAELDLVLAELAYKKKELDAQGALQTIDHRIMGHRNKIASLHKKLSDRQHDLNESIRYAPHDGLVVYRMLGHRDKKKIEIGERVGPWAQPLDLPDYTYMKVRTQVPQSVVGRITVRRENGQSVTPGSRVKVRVKTLPGHVYPGEVTWIDNWANDRNVDKSDTDRRKLGLSGIQVFYLEARLLESDPERLREGFRAEVEFTLETKHGVLAIPSACVEWTLDGSVVYRREGSAWVRRPVTLGVQAHEVWEVVSGLEEGDELLLLRPPEPARKDEAPLAEDSKEPKDAKASSPETQRKSGSPEGRPMGEAGRGEGRARKGPAVDPATMTPEQLQEFRARMTPERLEQLKQRNPAAYQKIKRALEKLEQPSAPAEGAPAQPAPEPKAAPTSAPKEEADHAR